MKVASDSTGEAEVVGCTLTGTDSQIRAMLARLLHGELGIEISRIPRILRAEKSQVYASIRPRSIRPAEPASARVYDPDAEYDPAVSDLDFEAA